MSCHGTLPHPIPYQGSKRNLACDILCYFPKNINVLYEPFAGSAAITIAAAAKGLCNRYYINDLNKPLMDLWKSIIETPEILVREYCNHWNNQLDNPKIYYKEIRDKFNSTGSPDMFLYLVARCVKGAIRYNSQGEFNQSPDNRRRGMKPQTMKAQVCGVSSLLKGKTVVSSVNYRDVLDIASNSDLVYMDPPYQGVCGSRDTRYLQSVQFCEFVEALECLNKNEIRYLVSYDGRTGSKAFGKRLPDKLNLELIELNAGRSSQATLLGRNDITYESLYLSPSLSSELREYNIEFRQNGAKQQILF